MRILTITGCLPIQKKSAAKKQAEERLVHIIEGKDAFRFQSQSRLKKI